MIPLRNLLRRKPRSSFAMSTLSQSPSRRKSREPLIVSNYTQTTTSQEDTFEFSDNDQEILDAVLASARIKNECYGPLIQENSHKQSVSAPFKSPLKHPSPTKSQSPTKSLGTRPRTNAPLVSSPFKSPLKSRPVPVDISSDFSFSDDDALNEILEKSTESRIGGESSEAPRQRCDQTSPSSQCALNKRKPSTVAFPLPPRKRSPTTKEIDKSKLELLGNVRFDKEQTQKYLDDVHTKPVTLTEVVLTQPKVTSAPPEPIRVSPYFSRMGEEFFSKLPQQRLASAHVDRQQTRAISTSTTNHASQILEEDSKYSPIAMNKPMELSQEQRFVLKQVLNGKSLFYTGSAGTGKSVLLRELIKSLKQVHPEGVAVTASTGLAACNIGGMTLHLYAGLGLAKDGFDILWKRLQRNRKAKKRWQTTKVLVIDEILMIDGDFFNKLDAVAKRVRRSQRPFGGIQVVLCGDFYQLPPVTKRYNNDGSDNLPQDAFFAFESEAWKNAIQETYTLKQVFRQQGDQGFIDMLNEMRTGIVSDATVKELTRLSRELPKRSDDIVPAELHAVRVEVDRANTVQLDRIRGLVQLYTAVDGGVLEADARANVLSLMLAPPKLKLKKGAQVMCIKNIDETLVNGSIGKVVDFVDRQTYMKALGVDETADEDTHQVLLQYTLGTSQNTSDYVFSQQDLVNTVTLQLVAHGKDLEAYGGTAKYPLVRFPMADGINYRTVFIEPEKWTVEDENGTVLAERIQLPLILAWSLSIHKSQGQTLNLVRVNLRNCFETGQAYVALSRAVSRDGLQVIGFDRGKVRCHPKVLEFYLQLASADAKPKKLRGQQTLNF